MNILFVKFGKKYDSSHVNDLSRKLRLWSNAKQFCYTDDPIGLDEHITPVAPLKPKMKGVWNKLGPLSKDFPVKGEIFYFDLDVEVQADPFPFFSVIPNCVRLVFNTQKMKVVNLSNYDTWYNSSLMMYDNQSEDINAIWDHLVNSGQLDYFFRKYSGIDRFLLHEEFYVSPIDPKLSTSAKYDKVHDRPLITYEELDFGSVQKSAKSR